jgi:hypothetical protein
MSVRPETFVASLFAVLALFAAGCGDDEPSGSSGSEPAQEETEGTASEHEGESEEEREREEAEAREAGGKECSEVGDLDAEPERQPPDDVTILDGAHIYESEEPQGKTEQFLAAADGDAGEMEAERDAAADALVSSGYKLLSKDQEEGAEAEAHLSGPHTVDVQVIPLCAGKLRIRYTVS